MEQYKLFDVPDVTILKMTPPKTFPVNDPSIPKIAEIVPVVK